MSEDYGCLPNDATPQQIDRRIAELWLWLGNTVAACVTQGQDWICDDPKSTGMAVEWLEIAEKCFERSKR